MKEPNWNEAPEGATHWHIHAPEHWQMFSNGKSYYFERGIWNHYNNSLNITHDSCHKATPKPTKTDKQKLTDLLDGFGVGYGLKGDIHEEGDGRNSIKCKQWKHQKVSGYSQFYTLFTFDKDGKFIEMGAWE